MKTIFKAYEENKKEDVREVYFRIINYCGEVMLIACDSDGKNFYAGNILLISDDGTIVRSQGVNPAIGLKTDDKGRVIIS